MTTQLISVNSNGDSGNNRADSPSISADGRYIVFESSASNLVPDDTNGTEDIFLRDLQTNETRLVSLSAVGSLGNNDSSDSSISADGRYVVFESDADNLVPEDTNGDEDIFLRDLQANTTIRISVSSNAALGNNDSSDPSISANGRYVVFESDASNLVANDTNAIKDIFVRDLQTNTTRLVSFGDGGEGGGTLSNNESSDPAISADGRYIVFESDASNLDLNDTNDTEDIYLYDMETNTTRLVSAIVGSSGNNESSDPSISADGRYVVFESDADNLVDDDTNGEEDIFVRDLQANTISLVSFSFNGGQGNDSSSNPKISADGRYVVFESDASNLVPNDSNDTTDIFVRDLQTNTTRLVSLNVNGIPGNDESINPTISADGSDLVFVSLASDLVANDTNDIEDVFSVELGELPTLSLSKLDIDANTQADALSDGVLLVRKLFGFTGTTLIDNALNDGATREDPVEIIDYINSQGNIFDIDGNNQVDALSDGVLAVRYLLGFRGATLTGGVIGDNASRDPSQIESYIQGLLETNATTDSIASL
jgi:Tol biopolymer transport system component